MMDKNKFLKVLKRELRPLPQEERDSAMQFYSELLNEAQDEQKAISELPHPEVIAQKLIEEFGVEKKQRGISWSTIVLLILSAPITIPIGIGVFSVVFSFVIVLFVISLMPIIISLTFIGAGVFTALAIIPAFVHTIPTGLLFFGISLSFISLGVLFGILFVLCLKASISFIKNISRKLRNKFRSKHNKASRRELA